MSDDNLGRFVSVHRSIWRPYAITAAAFAIGSALLADRFGVDELAVPLAICAIITAWYVYAALRAWRVRVTVYERGFTWVNGREVARVGWNDVAGVRAIGGRRSGGTTGHFVYEVTVRGRAVALHFPMLERLWELREAIENRRPTPATMPEARLHRQR